MTTQNKLDLLKSQVDESYIDFTPEQSAALKATKSVPEFERLITGYIRDHNDKWNRENPK